MIESLRNEFVDAMARTYEDDIEGERWEDARDSLYLAARRLIEAIDAKQDPTTKPSVRQYTEDEIREAYERFMGKYNITPRASSLIYELRRNR